MMYESFFGFNSPPFKITPDPAFLYWTRHHKVAVNTLTMGVEHMVPIVVISGDVGTGKTTLLRQFLEDAPEDLTIGLISNSSSGLYDIYVWIAKAFDIPAEGSSVEMHQEFEKFVLKEYAEGRRCVLLVDEAQNLSDDDLEKLRMLTNINVGRDVLLQLFLIGQKELGARLHQPNNRQIAQRVGAECQLGPMSEDDTKRYVRHRLSIAGATREIFSDEALAIIHEAADGVPRLINLICELTLVEAFGAGVETIDRTFMEDFFEDAAANGMLAHLALPTMSGTSPTAKPEPARSQGEVDKLKTALPRREKFPVKPDRSKPKPLVLKQPGFGESGTSSPFRLNENREGAPQQQNPVEAGPRQENAIQTTIKVLEPESTAAQPPLSASTQPATIAERSQTTSRKVPVKHLDKAAVGSLALVAMVLFYNAVSPGSDDDPAQQTALVMPQEQPESGVAGSETASATQLPPAPVPLDNPGGPVLMEQALELGVSDPDAAALAYARAALRGEDRAAYYLGQLYETGDGVPPSMALARAWYERASETVRSARRRMDGMEPPNSDGNLAPPRPILGGPLVDGGAEFVWTIGNGSDPKFYIVETAVDRNAAISRYEPQTQSAMLTETLGPARIWRVISANPETAQYVVSDWVPMGADPEPSALGTDPVMPHATILASPEHSQAKLQEVIASLNSADIRFEIEESAPEVGGPSEVRHLYDADRDQAERIAAILGVPVVESASAAPLAMPGHLILSLAP